MALISISTDYALAAGQSVAGADQSGFYVFQAGGARPFNIEIDGSVSLSSSGSAFSLNTFFFDGGFYDGAVMTIGASANITVTSAYDASVIGGSWQPDIFNHGHIAVTASHAAYGFVVYDNNDRVVNTGTLDVRSEHSARAVLLANHSDFENSGTITAHGGDEATNGLEVYKFDSNILNSGTISASDSDSTRDCVSVNLESSTNGSTFTNSGTLSGDYALFMTPTDFTHAQRIVNTGLMIGKVSLGNGPSIFENSGHVTGAVDLGAGADTYSGANGVLDSPLTGGDGNDSLSGGAGTLMGGQGDDTIAGSSAPDYLRGDDGNDVIDGGTAFDDINGNMGNDTLHGGAGDDWVVGGKDNDVQFGDDGDDIVWGNLGDDTLDGGNGNDQVRGGKGDDVLSGGAGNDYISGDRGNDTETGGAGADRFHSSAGAGIDRVLDFSYAEGDRVMLDPGTAYTLSQVGADTVVDMGNGDEVILVGVSLNALPSDFIFLSF